MATYNWPTREQASVIGKPHDRLDGVAKALNNDRQHPSRLVNEGFAKLGAAPASEPAPASFFRRNWQSLQPAGAAVEQDAASPCDDASIDDALAAEWTWLRKF